MTKLKNALDSKNVTMELGVNPMLYTSILSYWKDSKRNELIALMTERHPILTQKGFPVNPERRQAEEAAFLSALPSAWKDEGPALLAQMREI